MVDRRYVGRTLKQFVREFKQLKVHPHFEAANHTRPKAMGAAANESIPGEVHTPQSADIEEDEDDISIDSEGEELPHPIYGSPSPAPEETSLDAAINDLSNESRTSLLQDICREIKGAEALTSSRLLAPIGAAPPNARPTRRASTAGRNTLLSKITIRLAGTIQVSETIHVSP